MGPEDLFITTVYLNYRGVVSSDSWHEKSSLGLCEVGINLVAARFAGRFKGRIVSERRS